MNHQQIQSLAEQSWGTESSYQRDSLLSLLGLTLTDEQVLVILSTRCITAFSQPSHYIAHLVLTKSPVSLIFTIVQVNLCYFTYLT